MKVKELIELLKKQNPEAIVFCEGCEDYHKADDVNIREIYKIPEAVLITIKPE